MRLPDSFNLLSLSYIIFPTSPHLPRRGLPPRHGHDPMAFKLCHDRPLRPRRDGGLLEEALLLARRRRGRFNGSVEEVRRPLLCPALCFATDLDPRKSVQLTLGSACLPWSGPLDMLLKKASA
jgi:hypothetical protein